MPSITNERSSIRLYLDVYGQAPVDVALSRFGGLIRDFRPFFRDALAPKFFEDVVRRFERVGAYGGPDGARQWAPLSPPYKRWEDWHYPGKPILQRTGRLIRSLTWNRGMFGPGGGRGNVGRDGVFRVTMNSADLGTAVEYAHWHQTGARATQRGLDARGRLRSRVTGRMLRRTTTARSVVTGRFLGGLPQRRFLFLMSAQTYGRLLHRWTQEQLVASGLTGGNRFRTGGVSGSGQPFTRP